MTKDDITITPDRVRSWLDEGTGMGVHRAPCGLHTMARAYLAAAAPVLRDAERA